MAKLERISLIVGLITGIPVVLGIVAWATGFFKNLSNDIQLLIIAVFLLILLPLNFYSLWIIQRLASPHKPPLIRSHAEPDTYLFLHSQWRKIPDWQTRDYLAHILGFRPGEDDITLKPKDEVDKLRKGPPLESVLAYAKK